MTVIQVLASIHKIRGLTSPPDVGEIDRQLHELEQQLLKDYGDMPQQTTVLYHNWKPYE